MFNKLYLLRLNIYILIIIDFLLNICYEKEIINKKRYIKFGEKMDDILKYSIGWKKSLKEK